MDAISPSPEQREFRLVQAFVELADILVGDYDIAEVLHQLTRRCVQLLDVTAAGLMLSDQRGSLQTVASSTERTRLLDLFQLQANEGACLECFRTGQPVLVADIATEDTRWPAFAPQVVREGFHSVHAVPLRLHREVIGALNLFGSQPGHLADADLRIAQALADIATIGILSERAIRRGEVLTEQLQTALNSRIIIEQAKGLLAHAGRLDMDSAFEALRSYGRAHSTRLSEIAHQLTIGTLNTADVLSHRTGRPAS